MQRAVSATDEVIERGICGRIGRQMPDQALAGGTGQLDRAQIQRKTLAVSLGADVRFRW